MIVMFAMDDGCSYRPTDVNHVGMFDFKVGDIIETLPTGKSSGRISQITYQNGYYWYDFTDGETIKVDSQKNWKIKVEKSSERE